MEAVGRLAGGIAHDFNNVLAGVFAYGEMLFDETPENSPLKRYAKNVLTAATRGRALSMQILAYSRSPARQARTGGCHACHGRDARAAAAARCPPTSVSR